jgi:hypothetical protein
MRRPFAEIFIMAYLGVQIFVPLYQLAISSDVSRWGWQMFSRHNDLYSYEVVFSDGTRSAVDLQAELPNARSDLALHQPLIERLCKRRGVIEIRWRDGSGGEEGSSTCGK